MIDVDTVATDADISNEIGGATALANIIPAGQSDAASQRRNALAMVLRALRRRTPPIYEADIQDPSDLQALVVYGALELLYRAAMANGSAVFAELRKLYEGKYTDELNGFAPTLTGNLRGAPNTFSVERR